MPLLLSVGMVTLAGKLVHNPVGSARLVPVRVRSSEDPRSMPMGAGMAIVGASGLGFATKGCCEKPDIGKLVKATRPNATRLRFNKEQPWIICVS